MALQFRCRNCGEDIIAKYLKVGEFAQCHQCGNRTEVPSDADYIDDDKISILPAAPRRQHISEQRIERQDHQDYNTLTTLRHLLFSSEGRISRSSIWAYNGLSLIISIVSIIAFLSNNGLGVVLLPLWFLISVYTGIMVQIKRYHDHDKSGWWVLTGFIPLYNIWATIELLFLRGTKGPNRYGADPLEKKMSGSGNQAGYEERV